MTYANRPARLNRILLALLGIALLAAGAFALAAYSGWPGWVDPDTPLVPGTAAPPDWVFWLVITGATVLGLLCLRWLVAQLFRMPRPVSWRVEADGSAGRTLLSSRTAATAVAADIESYSEVHTAHAWLAGHRATPELHLAVTAEPGADIARLRDRIHDEAVARLRRALDVGELPIRLELGFADAGQRARLR
ncbi:alkaline shock response membrane anchor protein AmaP [Nocardia carnea]|uniref:alkaline shock response membrane anchor protein AmaP n=1 Tax=Nocardia carnea TaxID=37328 RepID=UPI002457083F|nr:alkaline shock response membrane anchor protein AmaP [Nocardia carnea]